MKKLFTWWFYLILGSLLISCQHRQNHQVIVGIFCINDFHGAFLENPEKGIPGAKNILNTLDSLKQVYPYHITIAAGDNYGGSYLYKAMKGIPLPYFFQAAGIHVSATGNHEFIDNSFRELNTSDKKVQSKTDWDITYLCANVKDSTNKSPHSIQPYTHQSIKFSESCSINVAFIGLTTASTPDYSNTKPFKFESNYALALEALKQSESYAMVDSADVRFLIAHIGAFEHDGSASWADQHSNQLYAIADTTLHGIFSAHQHTLVCNRINDRKYPITQAGKFGTHIAIMKVIYDTLQQRVISVIPEICKVNSATHSSVATSFDLLLDSLLTHTKIEGYQLNQVLCNAETALLHTTASRHSFTELGNLICKAYATAYRNAAHTHPNDSTPIIGLAHFGSIRNDLNPGEINVLEAGSTLPYPNRLRAFRLNGWRLKELLTFGINNHKYGWLQSSDIEMHCNSTSPLRVNSVKYVTPSGTRITIADEIPCIVVVDEFIVTGGDNYRIKDFPEDREIPIDLPNTTQAFFQYLQQQKSIGADTLSTYKLIIKDKHYCSLKAIQ